MTTRADTGGLNGDLDVDDNLADEQETPGMECSTDFDSPPSAGPASSSLTSTPVSSLFQTIRVAANRRSALLAANAGTAENSRNTLIPPARLLIRKRGPSANLDAANSDLLSLFKMKMLENSQRREEERQQREMERNDARKRWGETMMAEKCELSARISGTKAL